MAGICVAFVAGAPRKWLLHKAKIREAGNASPRNASQHRLIGKSPMQLAHRRAKSWFCVRLRHFRDHLLDDGLAERIEILRHYAQNAPGPPMTLLR